MSSATFCVASARGPEYAVERVTNCTWGGEVQNTGYSLGTINMTMFFFSFSREPVVDAVD